jgi:hypothetical protein
VVASGCAKARADALTSPVRERVLCCLRSGAPGVFFDPAVHVGSIASSSPPRIFILADPRDTKVSFSSQRDYFERLTQVGLPARLLIGKAKPPLHHGLSTEAMLVILECARDRSDEFIADFLDRLGK